MRIIIGTLACCAVACAAKDKSASLDAMHGQAKDALADVAGDAIMMSTTVVHANAPWYQERAESEMAFQGVLKPLPVMNSPGGRGGLTHELVNEASRWPVYAGARAEALNPFEDQPVVIHGKLIDLAGEGFGTELWPGRIARISAP